MMRLIGGVSRNEDSIARHRRKLAAKTTGGKPRILALASHVPLLPDRLRSTRGYLRLQLTGVPTALLLWGVPRETYPPAYALGRRHYLG